MTKTIFITGASSGIGAATARACASAGWNVGLMARSEAKLAALADEIGSGALVYAGDASELAAQEAAIAATVEKFGALDAAFANAGMGLNTAGTEAGDPEEWQRLVDINILGLLWTAKAALPHLKETKGHMLMTGSAAGRRHIPGSVYGASKWFVHGYGGNLAEEMRRWGGRCTVIAPGMVDTPFFSSAKPDKLQAEDIAAAVMHALNADPRATVQEIYLMPTN
ncbi:MAG: SDR family oxidoreductase [Pseudomonadota bacterium]